MNKTSKAVLAAGTASFLLVGGAGSLAYWTGTANLSGGSVSSGELKLSAGTCGSWMQGTTAFDVSTAKIVPGDTLTKTCTYTITATGTNIAASLGVNTPTATGSNALASALNVSGAFTVNGVAATTLSAANNGQTLSATMTAAFPMGTTSDNTSQALTATLSSYVVTATQTHS